MNEVSEERRRRSEALARRLAEAELEEAAIDRRYAPPTITVSRREYRAGDCVTWGQGPDEDHTTEVVPCSSEHLLQMTGKVVIELDEFPADGFASFAANDCVDLADDLMDRPLNSDPSYAVGTLRPTPEGWSRGDRDLWCGVSVPDASADHHFSDADQFVPFTGDARDDASPSTSVAAA